VRVLWHWFTMGPYHFGRMTALATHPEIRLRVVETANEDDHGWERTEVPGGLDLVSLTTKRFSDAVCSTTSSAYRDVLEDYGPDVVVESGYAERHSNRVLFDYVKRHPSTMTLLWSETTAIDHRRRRLREELKSYLVTRFDGALVAGGPQARYLGALGMPSARIRIVGGCVDNEFFASETDRARLQPARRLRLGLPQRYFLYVGRFIREKNLKTLLAAYDYYRAERGPRAWDLVLVGAGPEEANLRSMVRKRTLEGVHFAGLRQTDELPAFYAFASSLILPSLSEPWGLVVNEAMAAGLPVLVSERCGCAEDLVRNGRNGFVFDPGDVAALAGVMTKISTGEVDPVALGREGRQHVRAYSPERFAAGTIAHIDALRRSGLGHRQELDGRISWIARSLGKGFESAERVLLRHRGAERRESADTRLTPLPITAIIPAYNEERNLGRSLHSLHNLVDEVFVVDSGSIDSTHEIAERYGAHVVHHPFETHARQWMWALANLPCRNEWILGLDADQRVTPELNAELRLLFTRERSRLTDVDGFYIKRRHIFRGRWIKHGGHYPKYLLKLAKRAKMQTDPEDLLDHHFFVDGRVAKLRHDLIEENKKEEDIAFWIEKHLRYAALLAAEECRRMGTARREPLQPFALGNPDQRVLWRKRLWRRLPRYSRPFLYFLYRYFLRLGFLDGKSGLIFHFLHACWFRLLVDIKLEEQLQRQQLTAERGELFP
jgi:glycosyltransferase involved in cell wall biosynthesis